MSPDHSSKPSEASDSQHAATEASHGARDDDDVEKGGAAPEWTPNVVAFSPPSDDAAARRMQREKTIERQHSIGGLGARPRVEGNARLPVMYRTMSLVLSSGGLADADTRRKKERKTLTELTAMQWHTLSVDDVLNRLGVSPVSGLDAAQAQRRQAQYGPNRMSKPPSRWFRQAVSHVFGGFGCILFVASIICFIAWKPLGEPAPQVSNLALAVVLLVVLAANALFNFWQSFTTSRVMASIGSMLPSDVLVLRDGSRQTVPATELTRGDIVVLGMGQKMAADMRIIEITSELKFDRSSLTGESDAIQGSVDVTDENYLESRNIVMAGTSCVSGSGLGVVTSTGDSTVFGRLAKISTAPKQGRTTLEDEIFRFVLKIVTLAITVSTVCIIVWAAFLRPKHPDFMSVSQLLVNIVGICVAFIPEGLPVCVTLSLTAVAMKLRKSRVLAKSLGTVETLGSVNVLCSDKTGTLTQNKMFVQSCGVHGFESMPSDAAKHITLGAPLGSAFSQLAHVGAICNAANFDASTPASTPLPLRIIHGDATDQACLRFAEELVGVDAARADWASAGGLAFNSKNKFAVQVLSATGSQDRIVATLGNADFKQDKNLMLLAKGAPDVLLKRCSTVLDASGDILPLTPERQAYLTHLQLSWANQGQRVLLFTRRIVERSEDGSFSEAQLLDLTTSLTVVGLVGIVDPPRPEIPHVVKTCRGAGLRFLMVTGDFEATAVAIARQIGIVTAAKVRTFDDLTSMEPLPDYDFLADNDAREQRALSLTGADIMKLQPGDWSQVCAFDEIVFSRTTPDQKLRIVKEFQARDSVVGMTGDGVNDAPALKAAQVGIAMGSGSEVAMEAADLVLLDDFSSILDALLYGRLCFDNLRKSIIYLLPAGSFSELMPVLLSIFFGLPQILSNFQMIYICCVTDIGPSLALVHEQPEANLLARKPRSVKKDRLVDWKTLLHAYLFIGVPYALIASALGFSYLQDHGVPFSDIVLKYGAGRVQTADPDYFAEVLNQATSVYFWTLISLQWWNIMSIRTRRLSIAQQPPAFNERTQNLWIFPALVFSVVAGVIVSYPAALQRIFLTRNIDGMYIGISIACGLGLFLVDEVRKLAVRTWPRALFPAGIAW